MLGHTHHDQAVRITGARASLTDDVRGRQRRYVISMGIRTVCVILTVLLWHVNTILAWAMLAAGLLLPYFAVVIANAGRENGTSLPHAYTPTADRPALESAPRDGEESDAAEPRTVQGTVYGAEDDYVAGEETAQVSETGTHAGSETSATSDTPGTPKASGASHSSDAEGVGASREPAG